MRKQMWGYTTEKTQFGKTIVYRARISRSEIIVQGEIKDSNPRLWTEVGMPKAFGLFGAVDQAALEAKETDFRP